MNLELAIFKTLRFPRKIPQVCLGEHVRIYPALDIHLRFILAPVSGPIMRPPVLML